MVHGRPQDFFSLVCTKTDFSPRSQAMLRATGIPPFSIIDNVTGSYSTRVARGIFLIKGLTHGNHASSTPIGRAALVYS